MKSSAQPTLTLTLLCRSAINTVGYWVGVVHRLIKARPKLYGFVQYILTLAVTTIAFFIFMSYAASGTSYPPPPMTDKVEWTRRVPLPLP